MRTTTHPGRRVVLVIALIVLGLLAGLAIYGIVRPPAPTPGPATTMSAAPLPPTTRKPPATTAAADPQTFARRAAVLLFDWDTTTDSRSQVVERLVNLADPTGDETPGLVSDLDMYLPSQTMWQTLAGYHTRQWLEISTVVIPDSWGQVVAEASPEQILPGTSAWTITGTRHREGVVGGQPASADSPVSFTMFITCQPSFPQCHLLRLSQPGNPLR